jgi:DNA-binding response OmpR family regulator
MAAKTILLVDDEPDIVAAMRAALERVGYRVVTAADGNMGLARAEREAPDLVVVDMMMPKKSGFFVLDILKRRPGGGPPVIMVTANEGARHRAYAQKLGVDDYFTKPFAMEELLASVHRLCPLEST